MDLDFYMRVRTCKKRVTGKQPYTVPQIITYYTLLDIHKKFYNLT